MFCDRCGKQNEDGRKTCDYCGSPLIQETPARRKAASSGRTIAGAKKNPSDYAGRRTSASEELQSWQARRQEQQIVSEMESAADLMEFEEQEEIPVKEEESSDKISELEEELFRLENPRRKNQGKKNSSKSSNKSSGEKKTPVLPVAATIGTVLVFVLLLALILKKLPEYYGAKNEVAGFETAFLSGKWETAYDYLDLKGHEKDLFSKQNFVDVMKRSGATGYREMNVQEIRQVDSSYPQDVITSLQNPEKKVFAVDYQSGTGPQKTYVILNKAGTKKFLYIDEWKVDPSILYVNNVAVEIPSETTMELNGIPVTAEPEINQEKRTATYRFEKLFSGNWSVTLKEDNRAPYVTELPITMEDEDQTVTLAGVEMYPDQELMDKILRQFTADYQAILAASLNRDDFSVVRDYFAESAVNEGRAENMYKNACMQAFDPEKGSGILKYELSNISANFVSVAKSGYAQPGDMVLEIHSVMNYTYLDGGMEKNDVQNSVGLLCYHQENGQWKLQSFN